MRPNRIELNLKIDYLFISCLCLSKDYIKFSEFENNLMKNSNFVLEICTPFYTSELCNELRNMLTMVEPNTEILIFKTVYS